MDRLLNVTAGLSVLLLIVVLASVRRAHIRVEYSVSWLLAAAAMLVLSRKKNETIIIDDHIVITVVEIRGDKVRLGIEAPKEIPIHRSEIHAAIHSEQSTGMPEPKAGEQDPPKVTSTEG